MTPRFRKYLFIVWFCCTFLVLFCTIFYGQKDLRLMIKKSNRASVESPNAKTNRASTKAPNNTGNRAYFQSPNTRNNHTFIEARSITSSSKFNNATNIKRQVQNIKKQEPNKQKSNIKGKTPWQVLVRGEWTNSKKKDDSCTIEDPGKLLVRPYLPGSPAPTVCANQDCRLAVENLPKKDEYPVPKIRHILWINSLAPTAFVESVRSWYKIHPDWTHVLWRDQDFEPFVSAHFPGLLQLFKSLPHHMMRVDMIRYMLLFKSRQRYARKSQYGGTYADIDYSLVRSLDEYRRFSAVVTREPETHSLDMLGMTWPVLILANAAFMMASPGHAFFHFALNKLAERKRSRTRFIHEFAGPLALTEFLETYHCVFQVAHRAQEAVFIPPSFSFCPFERNRLTSSSSKGVATRLTLLRRLCKQLPREPKPHRNLTVYCTDVDNMDPITDGSQPVFAVHDRKKTSIYGADGLKQFGNVRLDLKRHFSSLVFGKEFMEKN